MLNSLVRVSRRVKWNVAQSPHRFNESERIPLNEERSHAQRLIPAHRISTAVGRRVGHQRVGRQVAQALVETANSAPGPGLAANWLWWREGRVSARDTTFAPTIATPPGGKRQVARVSHASHAECPKPTARSICLPPNNFTHY